MTVSHSCGSLYCIRGRFRQFLMYLRIYYLRRPQIHAELPKTLCKKWELLQTPYTTIKKATHFACSRNLTLGSRYPQCAQTRPPFWGLGCAKLFFKRRGGRRPAPFKMEPSSSSDFAAPGVSNSEGLPLDRHSRRVSRAQRQRRARGQGTGSAPASRGARKKSHDLCPSRCAQMRRARGGWGAS